MTCRHKTGDPNCTTQNPGLLYQQQHASEVRRLEQELEKLTNNTPDAENYEILDAVQVKSHLVCKVRYPSCENCSYEGIKIMVFEGVSALSALKWKRIDPHFSDPSSKSLPTHAPAPAARFPANTKGWNRALKFAESM
jgi:hypothetical protein